MKERFASLAEKVKQAASSTADLATSTAKSATLLVGDLNNDGKVDFEDAKIAAEWAKKTTSAAASEVGKLGKEALKSDIVKDAAGGALVGAAIASAVPFVGTIAGATAGAVIGVVSARRK